MTEDPVVSSVPRDPPPRARSRLLVWIGIALPLTLALAFAGLRLIKSGTRLPSGQQTASPAAPAGGAEQWTAAPEVHHPFWFATSKNVKEVSRKQLGTVWRRNREVYRREDSFGHDVPNGDDVAEQKQTYTYRYASAIDALEVAESRKVWIAIDRETKREFRLRPSAPASSFGAENAALCDRLGGSNDVIVIVAVRSVSGRIGMEQTSDPGRYNPFVQTGFASRLQPSNYVELETQSITTACNDLRTDYINHMVTGLNAASEKTAELTRQLQLLNESLTAANERLEHLSHDLAKAHGDLGNVRTILEEPCKTDLATCQSAISGLGRIDSSEADAGW